MDVRVFNNGANDQLLPFTAGTIEKTNVEIIVTITVKPNTNRSIPADCRIGFRPGSKLMTRRVIQTENNRPISPPHEARRTRADGPHGRPRWRAQRPMQPPPGTGAIPPPGRHRRCHDGRQGRGEATMADGRDGRVYRFEPADTSAVFLGLGSIQYGLIGRGLHT